MESLIHVKNNQVTLTMTSEGSWFGEESEPVSWDYILDIKDEELVITLDGEVQNNEEFLPPESIAFLFEQTKALQIQQILAAHLFK